MGITTLICTNTEIILLTVIESLMQLLHNYILKAKSCVLTALPWFLWLFLLGQQVRPKNERHTAKHRAENTIWMTLVTTRGTHRRRVVLWGGTEEWS